MREPGRLSALHAYIEGLPAGLDSHPECQAKASICRSALDARPLPPEVVQGLPLQLSALIERPPPVSSWMPETHSRAAMLAVYDHHFDDPMAWERWAYEQQLALFEGPLYSVAMRMESVQVLFKNAPNRWQMFHRGTDVRLVELRGDGSVLRFDYPRGIYDAISRLGLMAGLRASIDVCIGGGGRVKERVATNTFAIIDCRWPT